MRVIIVEDEKMVVRRLARCVKSVLGASLQQLDVVEDLRSAQARLKETRPDVLLLDLNLRGRDGFEILRHAVAGAFDTIVVSANTDRAIEAYEYGVIDRSTRNDWRRHSSGSRAGTARAWRCVI
jgi:two-component system response regulator LytT